MEHRQAAHAFVAVEQQDSACAEAVGTVRGDPICRVTSRRHHGRHRRRHHLVRECSVEWRGEGVVADHGDDAEVPGGPAGKPVEIEDEWPYGVDGG